MDIMTEAITFEKLKMNKMSTGDRIFASREAKRLILRINEIYKENNDPILMDLMKRITAKKKKIELKLKGRKVQI